jgi:hypothetical protein
LPAASAAIIDSFAVSIALFYRLASLKSMISGVKNKMVFSTHF